MASTRNRGRRASLMAMAVLVVAGIAACGKKAPPFLPVPLAAKDLSVREVLVRGGEVTVTFRVPSEVFSFAGEEERWSQAQLLRRGAGESEFAPVARAAPEEGFEFGDRGYVTDQGAASGAAYQYRLELRKAESEEWATAGPFEVTLAGLPVLAEAPRIDSREGALAVTWKRPAGAPEGTSWIILRREEPDGTPLPVTPAPVAALSYVDTRVVAGGTYCYSVSAVVTEGVVILEGEPSPEACGATADRTPPPPPGDLIAVVEEGGIRLSWIPSRAGDVVEHRVYRSGDGGPFTLLATVPAPGSRYLDEDVTPGAAYSYRISAVDRPPARNESPFSNAVRIVFTGK